MSVSGNPLTGEFIYNSDSTHTLEDLQNMIKVYWRYNRLISISNQVTQSTNKNIKYSWVIMTLLMSLLRESIFSLWMAQSNALWSNLLWRMKHTPNHNVSMKLKEPTVFKTWLEYGRKFWLPLILYIAVFISYCIMINFMFNTLLYHC